MRDEINTMLITGSETTAITMSFLFLMLASFPDIQNRAYEELYDMYGSSDPKDVPIKYKDITEMEYLDRVIKETCRLFPPAPFVGRTASTDIKVNENLVIPRNSSLIFSIFTLHRKEKYWTEPLRFNPDRFLEKNYDSKCFLPFGSGKRSCIGKKFAMFQIKTITANILRKFIVTIDHPVSVKDVNLKFTVTLNPREPIYLRFYKR
ncbi:PREDICTED: cytochrome P450 3A13-like [Polistes dominula]|uniref:Cytochrome P450 3A13-like n=1 Tax=Polistes dominula TaxID=743375 RepID=A0ABM1I081_POLDO|nr:PREDICTED: cytochrome P450 3A13-like [Polistes dominula]